MTTSATAATSTTKSVSSDAPTEGSSTTTAPKATTNNSGGISDANLDAALQDRRYLMRQLKCALGEAPCDPVGKRLKSKQKTQFPFVTHDVNDVLMGG